LQIKLMVQTHSKYQDAINSLFTDARLKAFPKNQIISYQGDRLNEIYLIKEGYVKAYTILDTGDNRTLFLLGPGDIFPIAFSLTLNWDKYRLRYFYQSLTDAKIQILDHQTFKKSIDEDPAKASVYLSYTSASNEAIMNQLEVMKNKKAINKVEMLLPYLISKLGEPIGHDRYRLRLRLSHQEVADLSGVTRETTTTLIKQLEKEGRLQQKRNTWIITHKPDDEDEHFIG